MQLRIIRWNRCFLTPAHLPLLIFSIYDWLSYVHIYICSYESQVLIRAYSFSLQSRGLPNQDPTKTSHTQWNGKSAGISWSWLRGWPKIQQISPAEHSRPPLRLISSVSRRYLHLKLSPPPSSQISAWNKHSFRPSFHFSLRNSHTILSSRQFV